MTASDTLALLHTQHLINIGLYDENNHERMTGASILADTLKKHFSKHIESFSGKTRYTSPNSEKLIKKLLNKKVTYYFRKPKSPKEMEGAEILYTSIKNNLN